jgi:autotransporter-associated beta strand protein
MKKPSLMAFLLAIPLAATAQTPVFTDNFVAGGSTFNGVSTPGGSPTASKTSYDFSSSKTAAETILTNSATLTTNGLFFGLSAATTSGFIEAQAVFTLTPVALETVGDYLDLTYTFTDNGNLLTSGTGGGINSAIFVGLYNSGGSVPVSGTAGTSGNTLTLSSTPGTGNATGNAANWQGYVGRIAMAGGACQAYTRPVENGPGTSSCNQDVIGNGFGGGTYTNPPGVLLSNTVTSSVVLTAGSQYTRDYRLTLSAAGVITISDNLYSGVNTTGTLLSSLTNTASTTNLLSTSFDGLALGIRNSSSPSQNLSNVVNQIVITKSIYGIPGPSFTVTGGGAGCPGDGYLVTLNGSVATNTYWLYTNGVYDGTVAVQTGTGAALSFGPISVVGTNTVVASNTVSGFTGLMSGSAVISILPGPVITNGPASQVVASGYAGIFTVAASGGGLNYQWYKNGGPLSDTGHISGSQTATLMVYPASSTDAATTANGYYVIVTNTCGLAATSTPNAALTLDTPAHLVWQGGNPNTNWDLSQTKNFTNSAGVPVVFNSGDDVTFDDSSTNLTVTLVGAFVDSTLVTVAANQNNYVFEGSGVLAGPGALIVNGSATLTVSNANSFTGGTTISSGDVVIKDPSQKALGSGTITLAGGTLEIGLASGASPAGVSNNINVTASSTLQYDASGTYAFNLFGELTGSAGATITLYAYLANGASDRIRLYGSFTNNSQILFNTVGNEIQFAPYNATGDQEYNGVISGSGGQILPRGAGATILNGANTFNDQGAGNTGYSLVLSGSTLGLGSDTVSSSPPTIDSSPVGTGNVGIDTTLGNDTLFASGGAHVLANEIIYTSATNTVVLSFTGGNNLTLAGPFYLNGADNTGGTNRTLLVNNTGLTVISGVIDDQGLNCGLIKSGTNTLYLDATNTFTGTTTVTNGTLAGTGVLTGPVAVMSPGGLAGGDAAVIGTLIVSNNLALAGNVAVRVNKSLSPAQSNDVLFVTGTLANTGTGTVTVSNLGPALVAGDRFVLFNAALGNGGALTVTGAGVTWTNHLAVDGSIVAGPVAATVNTNAFTLTNSYLNGSLSLAWPLNHTGYRLQAQTNTLGTGLGTNWVTVSNVNSVIPSQTNRVSIPVNPASPAVFFRLIYP